VAYHFHRLAPYGVLANLLAMPVISIWVMPLGIIGLMALPFGLDGSLWWLMGEGIAWMIAVAVWVAGLPGAVGRMNAFGAGPLLLCSAGLVVLCLLRTWLRLAGPLLIGCALVWALSTPQPDVLIAPEAEAIAVRGADGRLAMLKTGSNTFAFREWLAADADARTPTDKTLGGTIRCDEAGCIAKLADGSLVAIAKSPEAFEEDCRRAALVISAREAPPGCAALVIDRRVSRQSGAMALRRVGGGFDLTMARPGNYDRPWAPRAAQSRDPAETARSAPGRTQSRDATPREEDLEAGD
jgi:competence protein ComEC